MMESEQLTSLMEKVVAAAQPNVVFSAPVERGEHTVITASEVFSGGGFGFGSGSAPAGNESASPGGGEAGGSGGGGGGGSNARPVAAIVIGPEGVKVRPIVDVTKIALAAITAWGAMAVALSRMQRTGK
jgi:uncharacterized spore protein YtfJ